MWRNCTVTILTMVSYTIDMPGMIMMDINVMSDTKYLGTHGCPRIFVFDALPEDAEGHDDYDAFLLRMRHQEFANATMLFMDRHTCMPEMIVRALHHVETPMVFVRHYDRAFLREVPLRSIVDHMSRGEKPFVKLVSFESTEMTLTSPMDHILDRFPTMISGMPMTRMYSFWGDHAHLTSTHEYMNILIPAYRNVSEKYDGSFCGLKPYLSIYYDHLDLHSLRERNYFLFGSPPADFAYMMHFHLSSEKKEPLFSLRALWWWFIHILM